MQYGDSPRQERGGTEQTQPVGADAVDALAVLGEVVRSEHGRDGIRRFLGAVRAYLPTDVANAAATRLNVELPPRREAEPNERARSGTLRPEQLIQLFKLVGSLRPQEDGNAEKGESPDPAALLNLLRLLRKD